MYYVHLDLRHLGEELIDKRLPFVRELARATMWASTRSTSPFRCARWCTT